MVNSFSEALFEVRPQPLKLRPYPHYQAVILCVGCCKNDLSGESLQLIVGAQQ